MNNSYLKTFLNVKSEDLVVSKKKLSDLRIRAYERYVVLFLGSRSNITQDIVTIMRTLYTDYEYDKNSDPNKLFGFYSLVNRFMSNLESLSALGDGHEEFDKVLPYALRLYPFIFNKVWSYNNPIWKNDSELSTIDKNDIEGLKHKIIENILTTFNHSNNSYYYKPHGNVVLDIRRNATKLSNHIVNLILSVYNFKKVEHLDIMIEEIGNLFGLIEEIAYSKFEIELDSVAVIDNNDHKFKTNVSDLGNGVKLRLQDIGKTISKKFKEFENDMLCVGFHNCLTELNYSGKVIGTLQSRIEYGYLDPVISIDIPYEIINNKMNEKKKDKNYDPYFTFKFVKDYNYFTRDYSVMDGMEIKINIENMIDEFILVEKQLESKEDEIDPATYILAFKSLIEDGRKTRESVKYIFSNANILNKTIHCSNSNSVRDTLDKVDKMNRIRLHEVIDMINYEEMLHKELFIQFYNLINKLYKMVMDKKFHNDSFIVKINTLENTIKHLSQMA